MLITRFFSQFLASFHELSLAMPSFQLYLEILTYHLFESARAYLPLYKVAETLFYIQGDDICN